MSANSKIALAVAGGYMLGRTKKLRLAMTLAGMLAGKKVATNRQLLTQGAKLVENNPQLKQLQGQLTGRLVDVAREAALVAAASRVESFTQSLQSKGSDSGPEDEDAPDGESVTDESQDDESQDEESQDEESQDEESQDDEASAEDSGAERTPKKAPAKRAPAKKAPAKKAPAKKTAASKAPAKKSAAKKSSAQRSTAKKSSAGARR